MIKTTTSNTNILALINSLLSWPLLLSCCVCLSLLLFPPALLCVSLDHFPRTHLSPRLPPSVPIVQEFLAWHPAPHPSCGTFPHLYSFLSSFDSFFCFPFSLCLVSCFLKGVYTLCLSPSPRSPDHFPLCCVTVSHVSLLLPSTFL